MKFGIVLPALVSPFATAEQQARALVEFPGFSEGCCELWFRDWATTGVDGDLATGWDPFIYSLSLASILRKRDIKIAGIGFGAIRLDRYHPLQLARILVSYASHSSTPAHITLGLAYPGRSNAELADFSWRWQTLRAALNGDLDYFVLPPDFKKPDLLICSDKEYKFQAISYAFDGVLLGEFQPKRVSRILETTTPKMSEQKKACTLQVRLTVPDDSEADPSISYDKKGRLIFPASRLIQAIPAWESMGVERIVLWPYSPSDKYTLDSWIRLAGLSK